MSTRNMFYAAAASASLLLNPAGLQAAAAVESEEQEANPAMEEVLVTGRAQKFYRVDDTTFATKTPTDVFDIPQSVQVLTRQLIEDQAARDTRDLYRSISGVTFFSYSGVTFRGFRQDEVRYDGVRGDPFAGFSVPQLFNIDRVESLKGVSGMLYGAGEPGGLINYVTRKPGFEPGGNIEITTGNRDLYGVSGESTGPLSDQLAYRVGGFYEEEDSFRNNAGSETRILTTALTWQPGSDTAITGQLSYYDIEFQGNRLRGVPVDGAGNFLTDISWNTNEASDFLALEALIGQVNLQHRFSDDLSANLTVRYVDNDERQQYHESRGPAAPGSTLYLREFRDQERSNEEYSLAADFVFQRQWAGVDHTLLFGGDAYQSENTFAARTARQSNPLNPAASSGPVLPLDLLDPQYGLSGFELLRDDLDAIPYRRSAGEVSRYGIYLQDQIALSEHWQLVGGVRYDDYQDKDLASDESTSDSAASLRGGIIYKPVDHVSLYLSYGEGFQPQGVIDDQDGGPFDPEEAQQIEAGVKAELLGGRLLAGVAAYEMVKDRVLVGNPDPAAGTGDIPRLLQIGEVTSRGLEMDLVGDITENWTFQANYAYNDARITGGPPGSIGLAVGNRFPNAPEHAVGLWTRYDIGALNSAIAGGIDYVGERVSISDQKVQSYTTVDVSWITDFDPWKFQVNIRNLFDKEYAASGFIERTGHFPGEPFTVVAQVSRDF